MTRPFDRTPSPGASRLALTALCVVALAGLVNCAEPTESDISGLDADLTGTTDGGTQNGASAQPLPPGASCTPGATTCSDASHSAVCAASGKEWSKVTACESGTTCESGGCVGDLRWHLARSVDLQWAQHDAVVAPSELSTCGSSTADDLAAGRPLCDMMRTVTTLQPRFAHFFGLSLWSSFKDAPLCDSIDPVAGRACISARMRKLGDALHGADPSLLLSAMLSEYASRADYPAFSDAAWTAFCRPGSINAYWGPNTCIPNFAESAAAREVAVAWGKTYIDAGVRALFFGEAHLSFGASGGGLSVESARQFKGVVDQLRAYASSKGISKVYFGAQALDSVVVDGAQVLDFIVGAQHLEPAAGRLVQPLLPRGGKFPGSIYGDDVHDANLSNSFGLPVLLDYDNWSWDAAHVDDIRYFARLPSNAERARTLIDHVRHLSIYNPDAFLAIPVSKTLGVTIDSTCDRTSAPQFAYHFSAAACGIVSATQELFNAQNTQDAKGALAAPQVRRDYWGLQLCGQDESVAWYYLSLLGRRVDSAGYRYWVGGKNLVGANRAALILSLMSTPEFTSKQRSDGEFVDTLYRAVLLREPDAAGRAYWAGELTAGTKTREAFVRALLGTPEAMTLYACTP